MQTVEITVRFGETATSGVLYLLLATAGRCVVSVRVCVYSLFTRVVQPQHVGTRPAALKGSGFTCSSSGFECIPRREGGGGNAPLTESAQTELL